MVDWRQDSNGPGKPLTEGRGMGFIDSLRRAPSPRFTSYLPVMSLKIRLQRHGAKGAPAFRVVVCESATRRDGRFVEIVGTYIPNPRGQDIKKPSQVKLDRVDYWIKVGAKPSDTVKTLINKARKAALAAPAAVVEAAAPAPVTV